MDWNNGEEVKRFHREYAKVWRKGHPGYKPNQDASISKSCSRCKQNFPATVEFFSTEKTRPLGLTSHCKRCLSVTRAAYNKAHRERSNAINRAWRKRQSGEYERSRTLRRFGVTIDWYNSKLLGQDGRCAICRCLPRDNKRGRLAVDHNHATMANRGLLCTMCNHALERMEQDPFWGAKALAYLERYKE